MEHKDILAAIISPLCSWYRKNQRILPWRENKDPYRIWVSEIMLQQTRVEAAIPYYHRFLEALPTVEALAQAPLEQLMKLWEGLGYYSRVKNMQKAAMTVVEQYGGRFPADAKLLEKLPGIGDYTAGAIGSIAFGLPTPAVDGNVLRVAARLCNDDTDIMLPQTKRRVKADLETVYPEAENVSDLTQGLMELGALICVPGVPKCEFCPLAELCVARKAGREQSLPVREVKKEKKLEKRTVFMLRCEDKVALVKRPEKGVLAGMWEFPAAEGHLTKNDAEEQLTAWGINAKAEKFVESRHVFTHLIWDMKSYYVIADAMPEEFYWFDLNELIGRLALPTAMKPFLTAVIKHIDAEK
ncbi:MAG: A/G-specific adenine glycosylase [Ruminococcaceae bacterium]|nr:A/G-specific adenine glycosylase [Oscillospiraceae bacterium]